MSGGGPGRAGSIPRAAQVGSKPVLRLAARGAIQASAVFDAQDQAVVADMGGWVQLFSADGQSLWQARLEGGVSATPAVDLDQGRLFVGTHTGWVCALRTTDGSVLWRQRIPTKTDARILSDLLFLASRQSVILSGWGGRFNELDAASGEIRRGWDAGISPQAAASADARDNIYYLRALAGQGVALLRVSPDGTEIVLHRQPEEKRGASRMLAAAAPVIADQRGTCHFITNGDRDSQAHAWSLREERLLWSHRCGATVVATPALGPDGALTLADMGGKVHGLAPDGSPKFTYDAGVEYLLAGPVCDAQGRVFLGDPLGRLHVVDQAGSGRPVFEAARSIQARPSFDRSGNLYVPSTDHNVYVFRNTATA